MDGPSLFDGSDKLAHVGIFLLLALTTRWRFGRGLALVAAYAVASELAQGYLLPDRSGDAWDVLADLVGAGLGWLAARPLRP